MILYDIICHFHFQQQHSFRWSSATIRGEAERISFTVDGNRPHGILHRWGLVLANLKPEILEKAMINGLV